MEMCYNGALVMPHDYTVVNDNEMEYVNGGAQIKVNGLMLNKVYCLGIAIKYCTGFMNYFAVAKEIYAHAISYYAIIPASWVAKKTGVGINEVNYIKEHSNPIDIGGDNAKRRMIFEFIWTVM